MRFLTYLEAGQAQAAVLAGDRIHALEPGTSIMDLLGDDGTRLQQAGEKALLQEATNSLADVRLLAPIPTPPTVRDFMTFESHVAGAVLTSGSRNEVPREWYRAPAFYFTNPYAVIGPHEPVPVTPGSRAFDLELEVAAVVGRTGRNLSVDEASGCIAGYTIMIDWSARDLQAAEMTVGLGPVKAKDTATTLGPFLVTPDELEPYRQGSSFALDMVASINSQPLGRDQMDSMSWSFAQMIAYASRGTEVRAGDIIGSGTCGCGCLLELWGRYGFDRHPPLAVGDRVAVEVQQLGRVEVTLVAGDEPMPIASLPKMPASGRRTATTRCSRRADADDPWH